MGNHLPLEETQFMQLAQSRLDNYRRRERLLEQIEQLDFPHLDTELSGAYNIATEMYDLFCENSARSEYFDSLMDFAPSTHAAREIRRLTHELINRRM